MTRYSPPTDLESLTNEQFRRLVAVMALTHADDEIRDAAEGDVGNQPD